MEYQVVVERPPLVRRIKGKRNQTTIRVWTNIPRFSQERPTLQTSQPEAEISRVK